VDLDVLDLAAAAWAARLAANHEHRGDA